MTAPNVYDQGNVVRCSTIVPFTTGGVAVDPPVVKFTLEKPDETVITYTYGTSAQLVKVATGSYRVDVSANQSGWWQYRFYSPEASPDVVGTAQASDQQRFFVRLDDLS